MFLYIYIRYHEILVYTIHCYILSCFAISLPHIVLLCINQIRFQHHRVLFSYNMSDFRSCRACIWFTCAVILSQCAIFVQRKKISSKEMTIKQTFCTPGTILHSSHTHFVVFCNFLRNRQCCFTRSEIPGNFSIPYSCSLR